MFNNPVPIHKQLVSTLVVLLFIISAGTIHGQPVQDSTIASAKLSIPDKLVVLTFDDSAKTHYTVVRPILKKYGFGATFFITEGFDFRENKKDYMSWDEIAQLHRDGFEIGNHTRDHLSINDANVPRLVEQLSGIAQRCQEYHIPIPTTFAWPGNATSFKALTILKEQGIRFARRGGAPEYPYEHGQGFAFEPGRDHPLLLPSAGDARPKWSIENFVMAAEQAKQGRIAILQFHGAPDTAHDWVSTSHQNFEAYMHYLAINRFQVISLRDLEKYQRTIAEPEDPKAVIEERKRVLQSTK
ncbi:MAG: polysaccharide deacetylase family protein [Pirellula sp.]